jgi:hypothetical protein
MRNYYFYSRKFLLINFMLCCLISFGQSKNQSIHYVSPLDIESYLYLKLGQKIRFVQNFDLQADSIIASGSVYYANAFYMGDKCTFQLVFSDTLLKGVIISYPKSRKMISNLMGSYNLEKKSI